MLFVTIQLRDYYYARWCCVIDGWFETGTARRLDGVNCPECGEEAVLDSCCSGRTNRALPFVTRPRLNGMNNTAAFQINDNGVLGRGFDAGQAQKRGGRRSARQGAGKKGAPKQWPPVHQGEA